MMWVLVSGGVLRASMGRDSDSLAVPAGAGRGPCCKLRPEGLWSQCSFCDGGGERGLCGLQDCLLPGFPR